MAATLLSSVVGVEELFSRESMQRRFRETSVGTLSAGFRGSAEWTRGREGCDTASLAIALVGQ